MSSPHASTLHTLGETKVPATPDDLGVPQVELPHKPEPQPKATAPSSAPLLTM